jgi:hypothetical protein
MDVFAKKAFIGAILASLLHVCASAAEPVYKVGSTTTGNPFTFLDISTNKIDGMMVDLMNTIAEDQGIKVDIQPVPFEALIPSLQGGKIDIMSAAVTITPVRAEIVDFSDPIFPYTDALHEGGRFRRQDHWRPGWNSVLRLSGKARRLHRNQDLYRHCRHHARRGAGAHRSRLCG